MAGYKFLSPFLLFFVFLYLFLLTSFPLISETPVIEINENNKKINLDSKISLYKTSNTNLSIKEIIKKRQKGSIHFTQTNKTNFGFTEDIFWIYFTLSHNGKKSITRLIELQYPLIDSIEYFVTIDSKIQTHAAIDNLKPFTERSIINSTPLFSLSLKEAGKYEVYIRIESQGTMRFPLMLWETSSFISSNNRKNIFYGLYFGFLAVLFFIYLLIFLFQRQQIYLFFSFFVCFTWIFESLQTGMFFEIFLPSQITWKFPLYIISGTIALIFLSGFIYHFLQIGESSPLLRYCYWFISAFSLIIMLLTFLLKLSLVIQIFSVFGVLTVIINLISGFSMVGKSKRSTRFFFAAMGFLLFAIGIFAFRGFGILPTNALTLHAKEFGVIIVFLIFTLGIADRIKIMGRENIQSQEELSALLDSTWKFVPKEFLQLLNKERLSHIELGDTIEKNMSIMFVDIRAFTSISEKLSPKENFAFLNSYLERVSPIIRKNNGFIDKYIGDAVMALFSNKISNAVDSAIEIQQTIDIFNASRIKQKMKPVQIGIGIHTGAMMLGTIGEKERLETTVVSDAVNIASRIEELTKKFETSILISEQVIQNLENPMDYSFRFLGKVMVKGKKTSISVFEIYSGSERNLIEKKKLTQEYFEQGLIHFLKQDFLNARVSFSKVLAYFPEDKPSRIYYKEAAYFEKNGVPSGWSGVLQFKNI